MNRTQWLPKKQGVVSSFRRGSIFCRMHIEYAYLLHVGRWNMMCGGVAFRYCNVLRPIVLDCMLSYSTISHPMPLTEAAAREAEEACFIVFVLCQFQASRLVECVCCELVCCLVCSFARSSFLSVFVCSFGGSLVRSLVTSVSSWCDCWLLKMCARFFACS